MGPPLYIALDDTDVLGGEGTGHLARSLAHDLGLSRYAVTRHQLLIHPEIPYTKRNSCNVVIAEAAQGLDRWEVWSHAKEFVLERRARESSTGLAVVRGVPSGVEEFGRRAQREVLSQDEALDLAKESRIHLEALGGSGRGVIGALAGVGLASGGQDGRYVDLPGLRELAGRVRVESLADVGLRRVLATDGQPVDDGRIVASLPIRPLRLAGEPYLIVDKEGDDYFPLIL